MQAHVNPTTACYPGPPARSYEFIGSTSSSQHHTTWAAILDIDPTLQCGIQVFHELTLGFPIFISYPISSTHHAPAITHRMSFSHRPSPRQHHITHFIAWLMLLPEVLSHPPENIQSSLKGKESVISAFIWSSSHALPHWSLLFFFKLMGQKWFKPPF